MLGIENRGFRFVLLFFLSFNTLFVFGQEGSTFEWGLNTYLNYSSSRLVAYQGATDAYILYVDSLETSKASYSVGLLARWQGDKIAFQTGLNYTNMGYSTIRMNIKEGDPKFDTFSSRQFVYENIVLEVPAELQFCQELNKKNQFFFSFGVMASYNLANNITTRLYQTETVSESNKMADPREFANFNIGFNTGLGWRYRLSDQLALSVQPMIKIWAKGIWAYDEYAEPYNRTLYSLGVRTGLYLLR